MTGTVLPDANVLFSRTLRDWLFLLSSGGELYTVHSTPDILAETLSRYRDRFPHVTGEEFDRLETHLKEHLHSVFNHYKPRPCPIADEGDHHVHAAAEDGGMMYLVTADRGFLDLPEKVTDEFSYEITSPDDFFCLVDDSQPALVCDVALRQLHYWSSKPSKPNLTLVDALEKSGCPEFSRRVAKHLSQQLRIPIAGSRHHLKADANSLGVAPDTEPALAPRSASPS
ncbi:PIN domain-containing protein [Schaalia sp. JY-X159]|uniref:PIN domain-containing protein n=1 Tax=Schaalia sp. JY-X159 TaxID=2758575 RepID=UPI00165EB41E|nr:PIN domain-containing protein [Schaalia sp. JY-X159]